MKTISRYIMTLALLLTAVTGAWADEPKVYTTAVDMTSLKVGDILAEGFSLTSTNPNGALFNIAAQRGKKDETIQPLGYGIDTKNITSYGANATFTTADGTYYPIDENGNVGNAWVVTEGYTQYAEKDFIKIAGVTIEPPLKVTWNAATKTGNFTMPDADVELTPIYEPEFTATFVAGNANTIQSGEGGKATVTVTEGEATYTGATLGTDGKLTPLYEGQTITLTAATGYKFRTVEVKKVKPDLLSGVFSVSSTEKVKFSKGNLRYASSKWSFFDNQYDYYDIHSADAWDHFGWSTSATTYGMNTSTTSSDYSGDFVDWGATMGAGWFTLSKDEWTYLLNTRSASTVGGTENGRYAKAKVNNVGGVILFPDTYTHPDGVAAPTGVNATNNTGWNGNSYTVADWTKMESAGCVFLPAAGYRGGTTMENSGTFGRYWSATLNGTGSAYCVHFAQGALDPAYSFTRYRGCSVRLVREVTE